MLVSLFGLPIVLFTYFVSGAGGAMCFLLVYLLLYYTERGARTYLEKKALDAEKASTPANSDPVEYASFARFYYENLEREARERQAQPSKPDRETPASSKPPTATNVLPFRARTNPTKPAAAPAADRPATPPPPFRLPRFEGAAHEVLGVSPKAGTKTIHSAYRFWIKRFHPDRQRTSDPKAAETACLRTDKLQQAKIELLLRRKQLKAS